MAIAGLHNVSAFAPSFFGESRSPVSKGWGDDQGRPSTRASSLLQMWRELEGEHVASHSPRSGQHKNSSGSECSTSVEQRSDNGDEISEDADGTDNQVLTGSEMDHEDSNSVMSEQSGDLGEPERERVRQIFKDWMSSGAKGHSSNRFSSGPQWLCENERKRVRIIREWVHTNTQQRNNCGTHGDGDSELGSQIEHVRDGLVVADPEISPRRRIRRLCGRQTLIDLLLRAQNERKRELHDLSERRPVSDFAHRNRIQSLLRGRFLRNERLVVDERPSSMDANSELGLLRQRHTVSGLREEFLSKLDNSASTLANTFESGTSCNDENNGETQYTCREREVTDTTSSIENVAIENRNTQEVAVQVPEEEDSVLHKEESLQEITCSREEPVLDSMESVQETAADAVCPSEHVKQIIATASSDSILEAQDVSFNGAPEVFDEHCELGNHATHANEVVGHVSDLESNENDNFDRQDSSSEVDELSDSVAEIEDNTWEQLTRVAFTEMVNGREEEAAENWQEVPSNQWFQESTDNNDVERVQSQESNEDWPTPDLQEAIDSWLEMPSVEVGSSVGGIDRFYFPDDDNIQSMELRELFSRRRVSSLLRSSFRDSLDQVLQSHVERQGHASGDSEIENSYSSQDAVDHSQEQLSGDQIFALSDAVDGNEFIPSLWDEDIQDATWPLNNSNQQYGTQWEVINELRIDMAKLQQRLNNMQSMLEACIDMQIELQRTVRQEVSAALNRSTSCGDADAHPLSMLHDESQLDHVRKGICCLCRDSNIDSLLYRCGHMCVCSKCAENLVQGMGKCPMCHAPVVEAVRAYFLQ